MKRPLVFVIENEEALANLFCNWLTSWNFECRAFKKVEESAENLDFQPNALLIDVKILNSNGKKILQIFKKNRTPIILVAHFTNYDIVENNDYYDICPFPVEPNHLRQIIKNATRYHMLVQENVDLRAILDGEADQAQFRVHDSHVMNLIRRARKIKATGHLLIIGEQSVGKTAFIKSVVRKVVGENHRLIQFKVNDEDELVSKLTGHLTESDSTGVDIFEITTPFPHWRDWDKLINEHFNISSENIFVLPPLRERPKDVLYLASMFLENYNTVAHVNIKGLSQESERRFLTYDWPGNINELKLILEQAVLITSTPWVEHQTLPDLSQKSGKDDSENITADLTLSGIIPMEDIKQKVILHAYNSCNGNIFEAAQKLKIGRATMYRLLHKYGIV